VNSVEQVELSSELESLSDVSWHVLLSSLALSLFEAHLVLEGKG
jgi:hypothetical protein